MTNRAIKPLVDRRLLSRRHVAVCRRFQVCSPKVLQPGGRCRVTGFFTTLSSIVLLPAARILSLWSNWTARHVTFTTRQHTKNRQTRRTNASTGPESASFLHWRLRGSLSCDTPIGVHQIHCTSIWNSREHGQSSRTSRAVLPGWYHTRPGPELQTTHPRGPTQKKGSCERACVRRCSRLTHPSARRSA